MVSSVVYRYMGHVHVCVSYVYVLCMCVICVCMCMSDKYIVYGHMYVQAYIFMCMCGGEVSP